MKEFFSYQEIGTLIDQGQSATVTRHIQARVTVSQPSSDSEAVKALLLLPLGDYNITYIETLLVRQGRPIEVVNVTENPIEDITADFGSIFYSSCARLYGQRRVKRKTEKLVQDLSSKTE